MVKSTTELRHNLPKKDKTHVFFLSPALILLIGLIIVPMTFAIYIMMHNVNLLENGGKFVFAGLDNFKNFIQDERALNSILITIKYVTISLILQIILGLIISFLLDRQFKFKAITRALVIIPMFMAPVISGLVWRSFFDPTSGLMNYFLNMNIDWLGNPSTALFSLIIVDTWQWTPFMVLLFMASLDSVSPDLYEAAAVEGAHELHIIKYIKLPHLSPIILIATIMRAIDLVKSFDVIYVMTKGGPGLATETVNMYAYFVGFDFFKIGYATCIAFVFTFIVTFILGKLIKKSQNI